MAELSLVSVVLFIATGGLVFILLFLFAKRQITRFTLKSARRPHVSIGSQAPKIMRQVIQTSLRRVKNIRYDPVLLTERVQKMSAAGPNHYHYRMKALDAYTNAIESLQDGEPTLEIRYPGQTMRQYLFSLCPSSVTGPSSKSDVIHDFCDMYAMARHNPDIFDGEQFIVYMELLDQLIRFLKEDASSRTQVRKSKSQGATDTKVVFRRGKRGFEDATVSVQSAPLDARNRRPEHLNLDSGKSSGYSSTDRSSSSRGSADRLLSVKEVEKEDPV